MKMELKVKQICKEKGISMGALASKIGISPISLSQCLSGNPSLKRLQEIAAILEVDVTDLFEKEKQEGFDIQGCIFIDGEPTIIKSIGDIEIMIQKLRHK